ncbi:MAG TPA: D-alanyl-D-alanine carboxypeptidase [Candidatus Merdivicinus intestinavium]|nr:D-alanyl-D-alanine carboxypeptidase [Candidatus Merdivicinus intestinavium]
MKHWRNRLAALGAAALLAVSLPQAVFADGLLEEAVPTQTEEAVVTEAQARDVPAKSAVLMDAGGGQLLFEKNAHEQMPPASITKIMTMLLVMEALEDGSIRYTDSVVCSEHAAEMGGSQIWLEPGEEMTVEELLKAAAVNSANDASMALAEYVAGSEEAFVARMNERAAELGMKDTVFRNPTGLDEEGHVTTAYDIALMSRELLRHEDITRFTTIWMDSLRGGETALTNTNRLVRFYDGCTGLKTGTTDGAGSCLSATAERDGLSLIAVSMGSPTSDERFESCRTLLDYGFSAFERFVPEVEIGEIPVIRVKNGVEGYLSPVLEEPPSLLVVKGRGADVTRTVSVPEEVEAPVEAGQKLGEVTFALDGQMLASLSVTAGNAVPKMNFRTALGLLLEALFR